MSRSSTVPSGEIFKTGPSFVQEILKSLNQSDVIISLLSPSYFQSQFCLAEAGVAMARQFAIDGAKPATFLSALIPPASYKDLNGALYGVQSGSILDRGVLAELRQVLDDQGASTRKFDLKVWENAVADFLSAAESAQEATRSKDIMSQIGIEEVSLDFTDRAEVRYKKKLRIVLKNKSGLEVTAGPSTWTNLYGLHLERIFSPLKMKAWEDGRWSEDREAVKVAPGQKFYVWVALGETADAYQLFSHAAGNQLGKLEVVLSHGKDSITKEFSL